MNRELCKFGEWNNENPGFVYCCSAPCRNVDVDTKWLLLHCIIVSVVAVMDWALFQISSCVSRRTIFVEI